ncbi:MULTISPECIES: FtsX-like permease family protein [Clostridium]|uniref:FtsX-like permease family protein n=1 Tax=Clostridium TaxID=1485 RepID=UPI000825BF59|nr:MULTISPECIES: ABC transporter permease [Clostridium]PJI06793.1 ABC transporter permease [Clostridium sp. CT7]
MTLRSIIIKNIKGNLNKFIMYYLSNAFVVMVFFIFANFLLNPDVKNVKKMGQMGATTSSIMYLCEVIIIVFALVFTNYSISSFLKSREKEFGLLSMFGLTKRDIRRYVMSENFIVSMISILTGLLLGIIFSKLFFMAISVILVLDTELPLKISFMAIALTILCFLVLFQGTTFALSCKIKNNNIIELLKGSRIAKPLPKFSKRKAILAIVLILMGYIMAIISGGAIILTMFPILGITVWGTYLLYSQFSVYFTSKLQNNKKVFYKGINMITLSQIIYKLKDNARILFAVSILSAVTLTASASVYSFQKILQKQTSLNYPQDISFIENGLNSHEIIRPERVENVLKTSTNGIEYKNKIVLIKSESVSPFVNEVSRYKNSNNRDFYIISNKDYNILAKEQGKESIKVNSGDVVVRAYSFDATQNKKVFSYNKDFRLSVYGENTKWNLKEEIGGGIINQDAKCSNTAVISDKDFEKLKNKLGSNKLCVYYSYNIKNWMKSEKAVKKLKAEIPSEMQVRFTQRILDFSQIMQGMSIFFFIGTFISILFFIASGSILYFKLFNEVQKDKQEFIALEKIGMPIEEVKKILSIQCFVMFFLPFVVAFAHTSFAIKALSNILGTSLSLYLMIIVGIYLVLQIIYYNFAKSMYVRQINSWN